MAAPQNVFVFVRAVKDNSSTVGSGTLTFANFKKGQLILLLERDLAARLFKGRLIDDPRSTSTDEASSFRQEGWFPFDSVKLVSDKETLEISTAAASQGIQYSLSASNNGGSGSSGGSGGSGGDMRAAQQQTQGALLPPPHVQVHSMGGDSVSFGQGQSPQAQGSIPPPVRLAGFNLSRPSIAASLPNAGRFGGPGSGPGSAGAGAGVVSPKAFVGRSALVPPAGRSATPNPKLGIMPGRASPKPIPARRTGASGIRGGGMGPNAGASSGGGAAGMTPGMMNQSSSLNSMPPRLGSSAPSNSSNAAVSAPPVSPAKFSMRASGGAGPGPGPGPGFGSSSGSGSGSGPGSGPGSGFVAAGTNASDQTPSPAPLVYARCVKAFTNKISAELALRKGQYVRLIERDVAAKRFRGELVDSAGGRIPGADTIGWFPFDVVKLESLPSGDDPAKAVSADLQPEKKDPKPEKPKDLKPEKQKKSNKKDKTGTGTTAPEMHVFGGSLGQSMFTSYTDFRLPTLLVRITDYVSANFYNEVGIYRVGGSTADVNLLKEWWNAHADDDASVAALDLTQYDVHGLTGVVKLFLRELSDPLFTFEAYDRFVAAHRLEDESARLAAILEVLTTLPEHNLLLIKHLIEHLVVIASASEENKMNADNLGIVFGPTVLRKKQSASDDPMSAMMENQDLVGVVATLITNWSAVSAQLSPLIKPARTPAPRGPTASAAGVLSASSGADPSSMCLVCCQPMLPGQVASQVGKLTKHAECVMMCGICHNPITRNEVLSLKRGAIFHKACRSGGPRVAAPIEPRIAAQQAQPSVQQQLHNLSLQHVVADESYADPAVNETMPVVHSVVNEKVPVVHSFQHVDEYGNPLPDNWEMAYDAKGRPFYIDHVNQRTSWVPPQ